MLRATPRFPDEDSTRTDRGVSIPACSAASTISAAGLSLTEPAKLKPSHFRNSGYPKLDRRSTYSSSALKACGTEMTVTRPPYGLLNGFSGGGDTLMLLILISMASLPPPGCGDGCPLRTVTVGEDVPP